MNLADADGAPRRCQSIGFAGISSRPAKQSRAERGFFGYERGIFDGHSAGSLAASLDSRLVCHLSNRYSKCSLDFLVMYTERMEANHVSPVRVQDSRR